jgi:glycosyltransferase involved in cell wall biosynthesis
MRHGHGFDLGGSRCREPVTRDVDSGLFLARLPRMTPLTPTPTTPRISCIICALNEGPRIGAVLDVATAHPLIAEVIVVDDGSTDDTAAVVARHANVRLITHASNQGKSKAVATGVAAARHELLMLLDADLKGLHVDDLTALAAPVLAGHAAVTLSLRRNSLALFRWVGIDFVSGERVVEKRLLADVLQDLHALPRFGIEVFMNKRIIAARLPIAIAHWRTVTQSRKTEKLGWRRGVLAEWRMVFDLMDAVYPLELLTQTLHLALLRAPAAARPALQGPEL